MMVSKTAVESKNAPADKARAYYNIAAAYLAQLNSLKVDDSRDGGEPQKKKEFLLSQAEETLLKSIDSDRTYLQAWVSYINVTVDRGRQQIVRAHLRERIQENPEEALYGLGKLAFQEATYKEAASYFQLAAKYLDNEKVFYFNYAYALEQTGD